MGHGQPNSRVPFLSRKAMTHLAVTIPMEKKIISTSRYIQRNAQRRRLTFFALVAPALVWFLAFMLWPLLNIFYQHRASMRLNATEEICLSWTILSGCYNDPKIASPCVTPEHDLLVGIPGIVPFRFMLGFFLSLRKPGYAFLRTIFLPLPR